ncbi:unnamed protein product [Ectocarpus sp. 8 AP-2014]
MEDCKCPDSGCAWRPELRRVAFEYLFRLVCILPFTRHVGVVTAVVLSALLCRLSHALVLEFHWHCIISFWMACSGYSLLVFLFASTIYPRAANARDKFV